MPIETGKEFGPQPEDQAERLREELEAIKAKLETDKDYMFFLKQEAQRTGRDVQELLQDDALFGLLVKRADVELSPEEWEEVEKSASKMRKELLRRVRESKPEFSK